MSDDAERLIDFVSSVSGDAYLKVEETLGDGYVRLKVSEAERRQAKHDIRGVEDIIVELLRNARDAHAQRIFLATAREGDVRTVTVVDDGIGVPAHLHEAIFEPRVTSKLETMVMDRWGVHGRGMALYSVRANVMSARIASSEPHKGCAMSIAVDTTVLAERADQSTWPEVAKDESGSWSVVRGPHNIVRRVLEFACEHPEIDIYLGSPAEVLATAHAVARDVLDASELMFCDDPGRMPVWQRPAVAADAAELVELARSLGLDISERTAHRVLSGELTALRPALAIATVKEKSTAAQPDIYRDRRGLKIHRTDLAAFQTELERAFDVLSERYYVHLKGQPKVTVGSNEIRVRFFVDKED
ncbi:MAG: ATP-binding protein [Actinomycetia bacterium]|nr:ATP-binding protein [Actinomycetes bacterium]